MLTLRLLGGLSLTSSGGPVSGRASQRRRLALLAALAVARGKPVSRDKLVALLWPDADAEHARHLLADSIYVLRDALGNDVLLGVGDDVSLNPERVGSDLAEFQMALDAGDRERAVSIYSAGGAFLDGVHVTDAPEFERWAEVTRRQVQAEYRRALESLANDAAARGKHAEAAGWWQQLAGEDPISSRVAVGLMRALAASGDRAGALEFARVHESIVRAELEAPADPAVTAFANELRHTHERTPTKSSVSDRAPTTVALENSKSAPALAPSAEPATTPANAVPIRWRYRRATAAAAVLLLGLAMYSALHGRTNSSSRAMAVADSEPSIAVLPLTNIGGDSANESFAAGMTEQLIDALARSGRLRVIAATSAFAFKGHASDVRSIAESLHVRHILEGGLQREGARIRVRLGLIDAASGATRWSEKYDREMKDVFAIEDDIARAVAGELSSRLLTTPTPPRRKRGTTNLAAYESYVRGRDPQLLRSDSGVKAAIGHFQRAIALDSTYAGAYAGLAHMYGVSILDGRPGADTTIAKARVMAMRAVALDSTLAEAHYELGFVSLLGGLDLPSARDRARFDLLTCARRSLHCVPVAGTAKRRGRRGTARRRQRPAVRSRNHRARERAAFRAKVRLGARTVGQASVVAAPDSSRCDAFRTAVRDAEDVSAGNRGASERGAAAWHAGARAWAPRVYACESR